MSYRDRLEANSPPLPIPALEEVLREVEIAGANNIAGLLSPTTYDDKIESLIKDEDDIIIAKYNGETFSIQAKSTTHKAHGILDLLIDALTGGEIISIKIDGTVLPRDGTTTLDPT